MFKNLKNEFQNIHYGRNKANFALFSLLSLGEFFYKGALEFKNFLYEKEILKEEKMSPNVICVGNLTTGGVGKTPIVIYLANKISKTEKVAIVSRGYGAKLQNKEPNIIKDFNKIYFSDGLLCGDEAFQSAKSVAKNVVVITCRDRKKAILLAKEKFNINTIILDDGFSNRKVQKDKTILVVDSKMRFGTNHLLPLGPLREDIKEIKRADVVVLTSKGDEEIENAILWARELFVRKHQKELRLCTLKPQKIYNLETKAEVVPTKKQKAIAFCAIGQPKQFFDFAKKYYDLKECISFSDHYSYKKSDLEKLEKLAKEKETNILITTQKDEVKLSSLIKGRTSFSYNVMELGIEITDLN